MQGASKSAARTGVSPGTLGQRRTEFGFKPSRGGAHTARTLMLTDLTPVLATAPKDAKRGDFGRLSVEENVLGKRLNIKRGIDRGKNPPGSPWGEERNSRPATER